jgi:hypothetical protein
MIPDLEHKANNEKYFKSIRYFSHSLKGEKRRNFISQVAEYNVYLAAQCIMSAEKDEELENRLIEKAQSIAQNFLQPENSAKGFLALAEFENFNEIVSLLKDVKKPSKIHSQVFSKILEGKNSDLFITFLDILTKLNNTTFIHFAINSYNGVLNIDVNSQKTLNKVFKILFDNANYGMSRIVIEKFGLYDSLTILFENNVEKVITLLLKSSKKLLSAVRLAYEICNHYKLFSKFKPEMFIHTYLITTNVKSNKGLLNAVDLAVKHNIEQSNEINKKIEQLIFVSDKKRKKKINQLIKKGLFSYLSNNSELSKKVKEYVESSLGDFDNNIVKNEEVIYLDETKDVSVEDNIKNLLIDNKRDIFVDKELVNLSEKWNISLMELSHLLRVYELQANVKKILDYGCDVKPFSFKTEKLLFLHKKQITDKQEVNHPSEVLKEGDLITFRIIGINPKTHRLNISCLDSFKPENSAVPTDE